MQLPKSTVSTDSTAFALPLGSASGAPTSAQARSGQHATSADPKFDQVIDGLAPSREPANSRAKSADVMPEPVLCPAPFVAPPPVADSEAPTDFELCANPLATGEACVNGDADVATGIEMHSARIGGALTKSNLRSGREFPDDATNAHRPGRFDSEVTPAGFDNRQDSVEPNEQASAVAGGTPRFTGLPTAALEHRASPITPPGLARLAQRTDSFDLESRPWPAQFAHDGHAASPHTASAHSSDLMASSRPTAWPGESARNHLTDFPPSAMPNERAGRMNSPGGELVNPESNLEIDVLVNSSNVDLEAAANIGAGKEGLAGPAASEKVLLERRSWFSTTEELRRTSLLDRDLIEQPGDHPGASQRVEPEAKFAAARFQSLQPELTRPELPEKSFVASDDERVKREIKSIGIASAKAAASMSAGFPTAPVPHPASEYAGLSAAAAAGLTHTSTTTASTASESVASAHEAVEVVLRTVGQASAQGQKSVNLQFSVGDADLSVRVQLHGGEVRTTFRTDSPELRAALSYEWQAITSSNAGDRSMRIVPASFVASEHSAFNASAGDTPSRQHDHGTESHLSSAIALARSRAAAVAAPFASTPGHAVAVASITSHHLHTVA